VTERLARRSARVPELLGRAPGLLRRAVDLYLRPKLLALRVRDVLGLAVLRFSPPWPGRRLTVYRHADVVDVLARSAEFSVKASGERMEETIGAFFLGMDPGARYAAESAAMREALDVPDPRPEAVRPAPGARSVARLAAARRDIARLCQEAVKRALLEKGEVDVVADLADVVPLRFARAYFGVPEPAEGDRLLGWLRAASSYVFGVDVDDKRGPARAGGQALQRHVLDVVASREQDLLHGKTADDVLGRMLAARGPEGLPSNDVIVRCLIGTLSGAIIPAGWLFIEAVERLLRLPRRERERLHRHARCGDRMAVRAYVLEAARFFPFPPVLLRRCEHAARLGGRALEAGTTAVLALSAAALDPRVVPQPWRFRPGRDESKLLLFGHATHLCQGKEIGEALLTEMALALFARPGLRRARGFRGRLDYAPRSGIPDGPYPKHLVLEANGWSG